MPMWIKVVSSNLDEIRYKIATREFDVKFKGGKMYRYQNVPESLVRGMMNADSAGKFLNQRIKPARSVCEIDDAGNPIPKGGTNHELKEKIKQQVDEKVEQQDRKKAAKKRAGKKSAAKREADLNQELGDQKAAADSDGPGETGTS